MNSENFLSLSNFDLLMLGVIGFSVVFGLIRGFIKSFISLTGWIVSMIIGIKFYFLLEPIVSKYITFGAAAVVVAAMSLFLLSAIIIAITNNVLYIALEALCGGVLDRSLGVLFGFVRGCLLVSFIFFILLLMMPQLNMKSEGGSKDLGVLSAVKVPKWAKKSQTILLLNKGAALIDDIMPTDFERKLEEVFAKEGSISSKEDEGDREDREDGRPPKEVEQQEPSKHESRAKVRGSRISMILNFLPEEVLDKIPQESLVRLQDRLGTSYEKIRILEDISNKYREYIDTELQSLTDDELARKSVMYAKHMSVIEGKIALLGGGDKDN